MKRFYFNMRKGILLSKKVNNIHNISIWENKFN